jgi:hypothetical protein
MYSDYQGNAKLKDEEIISNTATKWISYFHIIYNMKQYTKLIKCCEISGSHGGKHEDSSLLGCCTLGCCVGSTSEMSVNFYQTTRCNIPEDIHLNQMLYWFWFE